MSDVILVLYHKKSKTSKLFFAPLTLYYRMFINADVLLDSLFNTERYQFTPANYKGFFFVSYSGPSLSEWGNTHTTMFRRCDGGHFVTSLKFFCPFSRGNGAGTIVHVCQTNMHCMTWNERRSRILQSSQSKFILWFQCSVRELIN